MKFFKVGDLVSISENCTWTLKNATLFSLQTPGLVLSKRGYIYSVIFDGFVTDLYYNEIVLMSARHPDC